MKKTLCAQLVTILFFAVSFASIVQAAPHKTAQYSQSQLVDFSFEKRDLKDVLNEFAQIRGVNILYPSATPLNAKVTFDVGKKIPFKKAWELILLMLEQAGFSLVARGKSLYALIAADSVATSPLPIYINTSWKELPDSNERLRYIYYFSNISVSQQQAEMTAILKNMFPSKTYAQQVIFDSTANALIITARAEMIKSVMRLMAAFDESGYQEAVKVVNLQYASATEVAKILTNLIGGESGTQAGGSTKNFRQKRSSNDGNQASYFAPTTKVVSLADSSTGSSISQLNTLIILGKQNDVDQVTDFIKHHLDVPLEQGKSFFHVIDLQWLPAMEFAQVLTNLISPSNGGQSTTVDLSDLAFDPQIKVVQETISQGASYLSSSSGTSTGQNTLQRGSNRVVVAATQKDWERIQQVVKQIDIPQKQVIIEALILDLDMTFTRKLASQLRTTGINTSLFPKNVQAQAGLLIDNVLTTDSGHSNILTDEQTSFTTNNNTASLEGDLSDIIYSMINGTDNNSVNSTIAMIGDKESKGIWAFFQLVSLHQSTKIISRPFTIAKNNKEATVTSDVSKRLPGKVSSGVSPTVQYETKTAPVTVSFTPLISKNNSVNLQVSIDVVYWTNPSDGSSGSQITRNISNNISLKDGRVGILGGLSKETLTSSIREVPFISKVPIIGNLFGNKNKSVNKTQLFVLIKPTIVEPKREGGMGSVTRRLVSVASQDLQETEGLFSGLKDPISRWVFDDSAVYNKSENSHPTLHDLVVDSSKAIQAKAVDRRSYQLDDDALEFQKKEGLSDQEAQKAFLEKNQSIGMTALKNMLSEMNHDFPTLNTAK